MNARSSWRLSYAATPLLLAILLLAGAPAHAERVQATFTYQDYGDGVARPVNNVKVEIWRYAPRLFGIWDWVMDKRVWTDANGWIDVDMPWAGSGVIYRVRVYAANARVTVWPHDTAHVGESWYNQLPEQTVTQSSAVLDFTHHFDWEVAARNFNIARAAWFAGEYMAQQHASLPTVNAQTTDIFSTFYDPLGDTMQIESSRAFNDFTIVHEYGHFVQEQIGSLPWRPTVHYLCEPYDPALAWMEGFAGYFSYAVARAFPGEMVGGNLTLETGTFCNKTPRDSIEYFISASLWDLVDTDTGPYSQPESHDWAADNDSLILAILDEELGAYGSQPTIWDFRDAWANRGASLLDLDRILARHGIVADFNLSKFLTQSVPTTMIAGHTYSVQVALQNTGSTTWSAATSHSLGSQNPQDNTTWGLGRVGLPSNIVPGQQATFNFTVTAPSTPGSYPFQWRMVQDGVEWFGDSSPSVQVAVTEALQNAQFISQSVPTSMQASTPYSVSITLANVGDTTWAPGTYFLGSQNPQDNSYWGLNRVSLPHAVGPGGQVTFSFTVTAPSWGGYVNFQWQMLQNGVGWFGDTTPNVSVYVSTPAPTCNSTECVNECLDMGCRGGSCTSSGICQCLRCL